MVPTQAPSRPRRIGLMWLFISTILGVGLCGSTSRCAVAGNETAARAFEASRTAAKGDSEKLISAVGIGEFSVFMQHKDEDEPKLQSQAKVHVYFDRGKYHVQIAYEKRVQQFSTTSDGKRAFSTDEGHGDEARIVADDEAVYVVNFSKRLGTTGEIFSREQEQAGFAMSGFNLNEPARLWKKFPDLELVAQKAGADAIAYSEIGEGRFRAAYPFAKPYVAEVDIDQSLGFNATAFRVLNSDRKDAAPVSSAKAIWKKVDDTWYVNEYVQEQDTRGLGGKSEVFSRSVFTYNSFDVNVTIEPRLFELKSFEIPIGTRFTDRRKKAGPGDTGRAAPSAPSQVLYWNGTALQAERP